MNGSGTKALGRLARGIYETHLPVADLDRSLAFYRDRLGLELASRLDERDIVFLWVGGRANAMLGLWGPGSGHPQARLHFAFRTTVEGALEAFELLRADGFALKGFDRQATFEPFVFGWMPAVAFYFDDPDGHLVEVLAVLEGEVADPGFGMRPYSAWLARGQARGKAGAG